jgi:hypothetical protein
MANVMHQRKRLCQVFIQTQSRRSHARDLRHLDRVRQPAAKVVRSPAREDLRLPREPPKGARLNNPLPVTLKRGPRRPLRRRKNPRRQRISRISCDRTSVQIHSHTQN